MVLLFILHPEIQSTVSHLIEQSLGNAPKIINQYFLKNLFG